MGVPEETKLTQQRMTNQSEKMGGVFARTASEHRKGELPGQVHIWRPDLHVQENESASDSIES
jgi:hypothetical protein